MIKMCLLCGSSYETRRKEAKYCSRQCSCINSANVRHERAQQRKRVCEICSESFVYEKSREDSAKYCSNQCRYKAKSLSLKGIKPPQLSSKVIAAANTKHKRGWHNLKNSRPRPEVSGENHWNWRGGIAGIKKDKRNLDMQTFEYKKWRTSVFQRDNYTCQICDAVGITLHADHIKGYSQYPELRYTIDNGRTLCVPCHYYVTFKRKMPIGRTWGGYTLKGKV